MQIPGATYRVQLNKDFRFEDATALVPYLHGLGISHLYASPIFTARKGSTHGYDVTCPTHLNPELGSEQDFTALVDELHRHGMGLLLDIVPNHMSASLENPWWMDVLENGRASIYSAVFDVEWTHRTPTVEDKIILPILGEPYGEALEDQKLQLAIEQGGFRIAYYESRLPVDSSSYHDILSLGLDDFARSLTPETPGLPELVSVTERASRIPPRSSTEPDALQTRKREIPIIKAALWDIYSRYQNLREFIDRNIARFNGEKGDPDSFNRLDGLLEQQPYQLSFWRVARERLNYRRFFDVTDLIGIRAQDPQVFEETHALVFRLLREKKIDSLRIDHIDGLYDPLAYLARLQARCTAEAGAPVFITVEKILSGSERLAGEWPVDGTSGYDFLGVTNNLFVEPQGLADLETAYNGLIKDDSSFHETAYRQKKRILELLFAGEIRGLSHRLSLLAAQDRHARDLSPAELERALIEVTASLPVYRTYFRDTSLSSCDREYIEDAINSAHRRNPKISRRCFEFLHRVLLLKLGVAEDTLRFVMRWQQLTGPVMAKGVEDTTMYRYNRLISMNDVGGSPLPVSTAGYHRFLDHRRRYWPDTMNASSTHDTKRSEDVRARINLLSEIPGVWERKVKRWMIWNRPLKTSVNGKLAPDINDEYFLYQTLVGAWPLDPAQEDDFCTRMKAFMRKAVREAKHHSSWLQENTDYENAIDSFLDGLWASRNSSDFFLDFRTLDQRIAFYGALNSLSQTLLKICSPGLPDFYQTTTLWDFSLVDPDNRRPPQVELRLELIEQMKSWTIGPLLESWRDGRIKAFLIQKALYFRNRHTDLFRRGEYLALEGSGRASSNSVSFARRLHGEMAIAIVPRFVLGFSALEKWPLGRRAWGDASLTLPPGSPARWTNILTGETLSTEAGELPLAEALKTSPVALLKNDA